MFRTPANILLEDMPGPLYRVEAGTLYIPSEGVGEKVAAYINSSSSTKEHVRKFMKGGAENRHARFDAGAAWMSLALQARKLGLYAHAMAGFHLKKSYQVLGVPEEDYEVIAAVAVGRLGDSSRLPEDLREMELPKDRKAPAEVASDKIPFVK